MVLITANLVCIQSIIKETITKLNRSFSNTVAKSLIMFSLFEL